MESILRDKLYIRPPPKTPRELYIDCVCVVATSKCKEHRFKLWLQHVCVGGDLTCGIICVYTTWMFQQPTTLKKGLFLPGSAPSVFAITPWLALHLWLLSTRQSEAWQVLKWVLWGAGWRGGGVCAPGGCTETVKPVGRRRLVQMGGGS